MEEKAVPILDTGPIDNRRAPRTTQLSIRLSNTGRVPAIAGIEAYHVNPAGDGFAGKTFYLLRLISLNPLGIAGSEHAVDPLFADLDVFGVRIITSGQGGNDIAATITEFGADGQVIKEHMLTGELARIQENNLAYASGGDAITVINTGTSEVLAKISFPAGSDPRGMALTPDGTRLYAANFGTPSQISVIDTATNAILATIPLLPGSMPGQIAMTPDGSRAYVNLFGTPDAVAVIDTVTNTVVATIPLPNGSDPADLAITPDGTRAYVATIGVNQDAVWVIDTASNAILTTISFPPASSPIAIAMAPDGLRAYVAVFNTSSIEVIDTITNAVSATISLPARTNPIDIAITPDGSRLYVSNFAMNTLTVVNTLAYSVQSVITLPISSRTVGITPDGSQAYVGLTSDTVLVIDTASKAIVAELPAVEPIQIAFTPIFLT